MADPQDKDRKEMSQDQKKGDEKKATLSSYTYCMVSTLNQMVNYLPLLLFPQIKERFYITLQGEPNQSFDQALLKACITADVAFPQKEAWLVLGSPYSSGTSIKDIETKIGRDKPLAEGQASYPPFLWNITGGQKPVMIAVFEIAKKNAGDIVMYLEGNTGDFIFMESDGKGSLLHVRILDSYTIEEQEKRLTIPIALQLMGFNCTLKTTTKSKKAEDDVEEEIPFESFLKDHGNSQYYLSAFEKIIQSEELRKKLFALNRQPKTKDETLAFEVENTKKKQKEQIEKVTHHVCYSEEEEQRYYDRNILRSEEHIAKRCGEYFQGLLCEEELSLLKTHASRMYPFGHFLEELFAHKILSIAKDYIADMGVNIRLKNDNDNTGVVDELDIAILTKTGQFVSFEVKSGDMHSDVAKSTKYTTYAISGVYGSPVLLSPLRKNELNNLGTLTWPYETSASAAKAAQRAKLPIICLDGNEDGDFEKAIKKLLNIA